MLKWEVVCIGEECLLDAGCDASAAADAAVYRACSKSRVKRLA